MLIFKEIHFAVYFKDYQAALSMLKALDLIQLITLNQTTNNNNFYISFSKMQLQPQKQLEQSLEDNLTNYYARLLDQIDEEEEQLKNENQFKQEIIQQQEQKPQELPNSDVYEQKEQYLYCVDGPQIKIKYSDKQKSQSNKPINVSNHIPPSNQELLADSKPISKSEHIKKSNNNKLIQTGDLGPILENDSEHKRSDQEVNSQQNVLESRIVKVYKIERFEETNNQKQTFGNQNKSQCETSKEQSNRPKINKSFGTQQIQNSILLPGTEADNFIKVSEGKQQGGRRLIPEQDKRVLSSLTTASKLLAKVIQPKNEEENSFKDPYLREMVTRLSKLQEEVNMLKQKKLSKASKSLTPLKSSRSKLKNKSQDFRNYSDDSLIKLAKGLIWSQLIESIKMKSKLQTNIRKLTQILNISQKFEIINKQNLIVVLSNKQMLNISYSQKIYIGQYSNINGAYIKQGFGVEIDPFNSIYRGSFSKGLRDGQGKFIVLGKYKHEGEWKQGIIQGKGALYQDVGGIYVGNFVNGKRQGFGTQKIYNGDKYEGHFKNGFFHGKGIYIWKNGSKYIGEFMHNKMYGVGTKLSSNGEKSQVINGQKDMKGIFNNKNTKFSQQNMKQSRRRSNNKRMEIRKQSQSAKKYTITLIN